MIYTLRWFGPHDPVTLADVRQAPGLDGVVTALHDVPPGVAWSAEQVEERVQELAAARVRIFSTQASTWASSSGPFVLIASITGMV